MESFSFFITDNENRPEASTRAQNYGAVVLVTQAVELTNSVSSASSTSNNVPVWGIQVAEACCMSESQTYEDTQIENTLLQTGILSASVQPGILVLKSGEELTKTQAVNLLAQSLREMEHCVQVIVSNSHEITNTRTSQDSGGGQARGSGDFGTIGRG